MVSELKPPKDIFFLGWIGNGWTWKWTKVVLFLYLDLILLNQAVDSKTSLLINFEVREFFLSPPKGVSYFYFGCCQLAL